MRACPMLLRISTPLLVCAFCIAGCGREQRVLGELTGQVTHDGQPVPDATLLFHNATAAVYMTARTGADGRYQVAMAEGPGLPPGTYQVAVMPAPMQEVMTGDPIPPPPERPDIPTKYRDIATSELSVVVNETPNVYNIALDP